MSSFAKLIQAHYSQKSLYNLPFTVAEGLAAKHNISRKVFLERIKEQMTANERLRLQDSAAKAGIEIKIEPHRLPLTKLALYILSLSLDICSQKRDELHQAMQDRVNK